MPCDHDLRVWVDGPTYLALKHLAHQDHRGISDYVRHVLLLHLQEVSYRELDIARGAPGQARDAQGR